MLRCIEALDRKRERGGDRKSDEFRESKGRSRPIDNLRSAKETAEVVGIGTTKVKEARTLLDHADEETKAAVESGEKSIHKAYKKTQEKRREASDLPQKKKKRHTIFNPSMLNPKKMLCFVIIFYRCNYFTIYHIA